MCSLSIVIVMLATCLGIRLLNADLFVEGIKEVHSKVLLASIDINQHIARFSQANVEKTTILVKKKIEINQARQKMQRTWVKKNNELVEDKS